MEGVGLCGRNGFEKEGDWLGIWKLCGKTTYLRLQCKQIEKLYDDQTCLPFEREMMRLNRICVLSKSKKGVAYDFVNELYNLWLKASPPTPWIETAVARSRHCIIGKHCANHVFNNKERKRGEVFERTQEHSKLMIECLLTTADIFCSHDPTPMTNDYFWKHVRRPSKSGNSREHSKEQMEYTTVEKTIIDRVNGVTMDTEDEIVNGFPNVDDDDVSVCSSVGGDQDPVRLAVTDIIEDDDEIMNQ